MKTVPREKSRHETAGLSLDDVVAMYRVMLQTRMIGERMMQLNRMGKAMFVGVADGHEAAEVGSAWCIRKGVDWCVPYYRDVGVALVLGQTAKDQFLGVFAKATDPNSGGRQIVNQFSDAKARILSGSVHIATQFPHAVGLALAAKTKKEDVVVVTYGGDGATSPGDFHEAMNFAAVHKLPVVFVIENNQYAISTPVRLQMAVANVADRAAAYGIPGVVADGTDVLDVYEKTKVACDRARRGEGPSLVEVKCYRYRPHSSDDDDSRYRTKDELQAWLAKDPIDRARAYLLAHGVPEARLDEGRAEIAADIERAIVAAESEPDPDPSTLLRHVYREPE
ncbi:MAG TPA: thiamine pyrophosphate-dependent dehydrogenase E1 component subunit alpha [Candidatus Dormibacteraeota bacterium]|nr:thiamine pyrophosphate-dependent dehydrogenase E1 component subunit alpha [Candidatus Dormibacteraeota bacterium]